MRVAIFGSYSWDNYNDFMRHVTLFIQEAHDLGHDNVSFVHTGKSKLENMATEYTGKTHKFLKQKNFKLKEELFKSKDSKFSTLKIVESGIDYALVFSTNDKNSYKCKEILSAYGIPFSLVENA